MKVIGLFCLAALAWLSATGASADMPKQMPQDGVLSPGEVVLVDDGRCPAGEVKQVTGGNKVKNIPREVKCVPKPR
ncbi:DUF6719 family protein [Hydrogenophaga sp. A37]|uniref:DUF6719 family protein n=1 Tax=Hydrogenophaga sp. A37 TaxID=1945864 RepID=UPI0009864770|nr:DUF6719 family protein [Hydrogenophaga sp. A37]OOG81285.1 hypothetical protein B0E41_18355 [Hydrogenophaga sp. A37]